MCGITGFVDLSCSTDSQMLHSIVRGMADAVIHRGPDDEGTFAIPENGIAFGFRRLSIIDLSPAGHQPMESANKQWAIVYNGEIYNAPELQAHLAERQVTSFRGHSDTEILLECFAQFGVEWTLKRAVGMFALAVHDRASRNTWLARDRLGKKPLYIGRFRRTLMFGSELRSLRRHPDFHGEIDDAALSAYVRFGYVPHPLCIYRNVIQLDPGGLARLDAHGHLEVGSYWDVEDVARDAKAQRFTGSDEEAVEALDGILRDAVKRRMVADVPLGAFLSGGIDSSVVVALMQAQSSRPVKTFSIGFPVDGYDEAPHAAAVAKHLKTDHEEFYVNPQDAIGVIPGLPDIYDEPFADSSQIPTYLVSKLARQRVTVALSGDGGDESFAGYNRYGQLDTLTSALDWVPGAAGPVAQFANRVLNARPFAPVRSTLPRFMARCDRWTKRVAEYASSGGLEGAYRRMASQGLPPEEFLVSPNERPAQLWSGTLAKDFPGAIERAQLIDLQTYLPDDILTKVDRASMAVSLEVRAPLLDHRVVEFAWSLPLHLKVRGGETKWALRQVLYRYVPRSIIDRPKMGFGIPIDVWLRGPLREWAESLINEKRLRQEGIFNVATVRGLWDRHLAGETWQYPLWCVLMLQAWRDRWAH